MSVRDTFILVVLAAIWGASFLFMKLAVGEMRAAPLMEVRIAVGMLCLLPIVFWRYRQALHWRLLAPMLVVGALNSALPFTLLAYATMHLNAGYTSLLNATVPLWSAMIGALWLNESLTRWQVVGVVVGFLGVFILVSGRGNAGFSGANPAIVAALAATASYAVSANFTKRYLQGVPAMVISGVSLLMATLLLFPLAWSQWPATEVSLRAWGCGIALGVLCTAIAYVMFFGLIERVGATRTVSVTFLIPAFGMMWGWVFLDETLTPAMGIGCAVIFCGTALTLGLVPVGNRPDFPSGGPSDKHDAQWFQTAAYRHGKCECPHRSDCREREGGGQPAG